MDCIIIFAYFKYDLKLVFLYFQVFHRSWEFPNLSFSQCNKTKPLLIKVSNYPVKVLVFHAYTGIYKQGKKGIANEKA